MAARVTDGWSWHWLFYVNIVPGMLVMLLVPILVRVDEPRRFDQHSLGWHDAKQPHASGARLSLARQK
jgi:MFS family permease